MHAHAVIFIKLGHYSGLPNESTGSHPKTWQKFKQVLLLGSFCKAILLANYAFWQASTQSSIKKCIYFLYK